MPTLPVSRLHPPREGLTVPVRGLRYHVRRWGDPAARPLLLLHGVRDCGATFQFMIDGLCSSWNVVAPDWRGHGLSDRAFGSYWAHDFMADLDVLLDTLFPDTAPDVVAHSMGGNVATLCFSMRPERVRRLVALDSAGPMGRRLPVDARRVLTDWLAMARPGTVPGGYGSLPEVVERILASNRRMSQVQAHFRAEVSTRRDEDGRYRWLYDPVLRFPLPTLHSAEEWRAVWSSFTAPFLWIGSSDPRPEAPPFDDEHVALRRSFRPDAEIVRLDDTGHNVHHDRPGDVARLVEAFLQR